MPEQVLVEGPRTRDTEGNAGTGEVGATISNPISSHLSAHKNSGSKLKERKDAHKNSRLGEFTDLFWIGGAVLLSCKRSGPAAPVQRT